MLSILKIFVQSFLSMAAPKPSGFANTKAGKTVIYDRTKKLFDESALVIAFPVQGVSKEQVDILRKELPKSTKATVIKNAILRQAAIGTKFEQISEGLRDENMFLFIQEGEAKKTYEGFKKWQKEVKRTEPEFAPKVAVMENMRYTGKNIDTVVALPTKLELITKIAQGIKAVPTKVAKGVKAVPNKLGRAIAAIKQQLEDEAKASA
jgi:large subunit ribosomal protein L10